MRNTYLPPYRSPNSRAGQSWRPRRTRARHELHFRVRRSDGTDPYLQLASSTFTSLKSGSSSQIFFSFKFFNISRHLYKSIDLSTYLVVHVMPANFRENSREEASGHEEFPNSNLLEAGRTWYFSKLVNISWVPGMKVSAIFGSSLNFVL